MSPSGGRHVAVAYPKLAIRNIPVVAFWVFITLWVIFAQKNTKTIVRFSKTNFCLQKLYRFNRTFTFHSWTSQKVAIGDSRLSVWDRQPAISWHMRGLMASWSINFGPPNWCSKFYTDIRTCKVIPQCPHYERRRHTVSTVSCMHNARPILAYGPKMTIPTFGVKL